MHYYQVPRLGSFLAIKLEYVTCLFEDAFNTAVNNYSEVNEKIRDQEQAKREWEQEQKEREDNEDNEDAVREEKKW
jgi:hypothetical protein